MRVRDWLGILLLAACAATGCKLNNVPPAARMMHPGPGVDGPGPGVLPPEFTPDFMGMPAPAVQVLFAKPESMQIRWDVGGVDMYDSVPLITPGRANFPMGGVYNLKLTNIERRVGVELYPTLEIAPVSPRSAAYLEHNAIPVQFTSEDFDQVLAGNFVTKVIYLPDPEFQELALAGVETLVSTRLDPGVDPIVEADRRGAILAIVRVGNIDKQFGGGAAGGEESIVVPAGYGAGYDEGYGAGYDEGYGTVYGEDGMPLETGYDPQAGDQPVGAETVPVGYNDPVPAAYGGGYVAGGYHGGYPGGPAGFPMGAAPMQVAAGGTTVPRYIAGVTTPPWGMTMSGTPIGLPGPPHIPHGIPAGLKKHTMRNFTPHFMPGPTKHVSVWMRQSPGYSYPRPANHVFIKERTRHLLPIFGQPLYDRKQLIRDGGGVNYSSGYCPDCQ